MAVSIRYEFLTYEFDRALSNPITLEEFNELRTTKMQDIYKIVNVKTKGYRPFRDIVRHYFSRRRLIILGSCIGFGGFSAWLTWDSKSDIVNALAIIPGFIALALFMYMFQFILGSFKTWDVVSELQDQMMQYYKKHKNIADGMNSYDEYKESISKGVLG